MNTKLERNRLIQIDTYTISHDENGVFYVDIIKTPYTYGAWIYHSSIGMKVLMYEVHKSSIKFAEFLQMVETGCDEYIRMYTDEYITE